MHIVIEFTKNLIPAVWKSTSSGWTSGNCPMCITNGQGRPDTKKRVDFILKKKSFSIIALIVGIKLVGVLVSS